ncbi:hypothetical protein STEG23_022197, partial [Scotinomys teguina]
MKHCGNYSKEMTRIWMWHTPLIPELGRQSQVDLCEFKASLAYSKPNRAALERVADTVVL